MGVSFLCDAKISASDCGARSIILSVSPGRTLRCVGLAVDTGLKRVLQSASSSAHPC